jgi:ribonuclease I
MSVDVRLSQFCGKNNNSYWSGIVGIESSTLSPFAADWQKYAPGYAYDQLYTHEWQRHGTCYSSDIIGSYRSAAAVATVQSRSVT